MPRRTFLLAVAGPVLALIALNYAVGIAARNTVPRWKIGIARGANEASVAAMGNSLIGAGFVEDSFNQGMQLEKPRGAVNLAMGGSSAAEQLLMLRYALRQGMRPREVIFGFFDFQLTHPLRYTTPDLVGNRAMLYYVEPEYARSFYHLSAHDSLEFEVMRHFELFAEPRLSMGECRTLPAKARAAGDACEPEQFHGSGGRLWDAGVSKCAGLHRGVRPGQP